MNDILKISYLLPLALILMIIGGGSLFSGGAQLNVCHVRVFRSSWESSTRDLVAVISGILVIVLAGALTKDDWVKHPGQSTGNIIAAFDKSYDPLIESLSQGILHPKLFGRYRMIS